jgi:P27 family predicted phage terminase small subunit
MEMPDHLGHAGRELWRAVTAEAEAELTERQAALLKLACEQADDLELLKQVVIEEGAIVTGSAGQPVLNSALQEMRQSRQSIARLITQITRQQLTASEQARKNVSHRWAKRAGHPAPSKLRVLPEAR